MKIVFFGTPEFAATSLEYLINSHQYVVGVVTAPDHLGGRGGKQILTSPVKKMAEKYNLPLLQPEKLKNPDFLNQLSALQADIFLVVAFRMLPEVVWNMPPLGSFNVHGSLLPKYRGAAPIHWAVINGEEETGVTVFKLKHAIDTGDILLQKKLAIQPDESTGDVYQKLMILGAEALLESIPIIQNNPKFLSQNETFVSHAPKIYHQDAQIDFNQPTKQVYNFIRGMNPSPGAWCLLEGKECKILDCRPAYQVSKKSPGYVYTDNKKYLTIATSDGAIDILTLKMAGSKALNIKDFLSGNKITDLSVGN